MSDATAHKPLLWVESGGGPLVVVPESALASWRTSTESTSADDLSGWGDYDRACKIDDYIGTLQVGDSEALVLADCLQWNVPAGRAVLFDSAWSGTDLPDHQPDNHLTIDLPSGVYAAEYTYVQPNPRTSFGLIRLTPYGR